LPQTNLLFYETKPFLLPFTLFTTIEIHPFSIGSSGLRACQTNTIAWWHTSDAATRRGTLLNHPTSHPPRKLGGCHPTDITVSFGFIFINTSPGPPYWRKRVSLYKMNYRICANFMVIIASMKIVSRRVI